MKKYFVRIYAVSRLFPKKILGVPSKEGGRGPGHLGQCPKFGCFFSCGLLPLFDILKTTFAFSYQRKHCKKPEAFSPTWESYRKTKGLLYPCNAARNIAREAAGTHFVMPADIELFPSPGTIPAFLDMIRRDETYLHGPSPRVFVLSIWEIEEDISLPNTKTELLELDRQEKVSEFHINVCSLCHKVPHMDIWRKDDGASSDELNVIPAMTEKRIGEWERWEPF